MQINDGTTYFNLPKEDVVEIVHCYIGVETINHIIIMAIMAKKPGKLQISTDGKYQKTCIHKALHMTALTLLLDSACRKPV